MTDRTAAIARWTLALLVAAVLLWPIAWIAFQYETHLAFAIVLVLLLLVMDREPGDAVLIGSVGLGVGGLWAFYLLAALA